MIPMVLVVWKGSWIEGGGLGHPGPFILTMSPSILSVSGSVMESSTHPVASPYAFLVAGGSLLLGITLFVCIVVR